MLGNECLAAELSATGGLDKLHPLYLLHRARQLPKGTICRKCYIHPEIVTAYLDGGLLLDIPNDISCQLRDAEAALRPDEAAVLSFLRTRVARDLAADPTTAARLSERRTRARAKSRSDSGRALETLGQGDDMEALSA